MTHSVHSLPKQAQVIRPPHKRQGHVVHTEVHRELQVGHVFVGQRGRTDFNARKIDPLVLSKRAAANNVTMDIATVDALDAEFHRAVREQEAVAGFHVMG
jgi:hypothetical protein